MTLLPVTKLTVLDKLKTSYLDKSVNCVCFLTFYKINRINSLDMSIYIAEKYYPAPASWRPVTFLLNLRGTRVWREVLMHRWGGVWVWGGVKEGSHCLLVTPPSSTPNTIAGILKHVCCLQLAGKAKHWSCGHKFSPKRASCLRDIFNKSQCFHHFLVLVCTACTLAHSCLHPTRGDFEERLIWKYE